MPEQFLAPGHSIQRPRILSQKLLSSGAQEQRVLEASDFLSRQPVVRESSPLSSTHNRWILVVNRIHRASEVAEIGNSRNTDEVHAQIDRRIDLGEAMHGFAQHLVVRVRIHAELLIIPTFGRRYAKIPIGITSRISLHILSNM